jgi:hypothetical protein
MKRPQPEDFRHIQAEDFKTQADGKEGRSVACTAKGNDTGGFSMRPRNTAPAPGPEIILTCGVRGRFSVLSSDIVVRNTVPAPGSERNLPCGPCGGFSVLLSDIALPHGRICCRCT